MQTLCKLRLQYFVCIHQISCGTNNIITRHSDRQIKIAEVVVKLLDASIWNFVPPLNIIVYSYPRKEVSNKSRAVINHSSSYRSGLIEYIRISNANFYLLTRQ